LHLEEKKDQKGGNEELQQIDPNDQVLHYQFSKAKPLIISTLNAAQLFKAFSFYRY